MSLLQSYCGGEANCAEQISANDDYDPTELVCPACSNVGGGMQVSVLISTYCNKVSPCINVDHKGISLHMMSLRNFVLTVFSCRFVPNMELISWSTNVDTAVRWPCISALAPPTSAILVMMTFSV